MVKKKKAEQKDAPLLDKTITSLLGSIPGERGGALQ